MKTFTQQLIAAYQSELHNRHVKPLKIAVEQEGRYVRVWAEIKDDDEVMEDQLLLSAASVNAQFSSQGYYLATTIVEQSDRLDIPEQYQLLR